MPNPTMQTTYDELVRLCYECVLDEGKWRELLTNLMQASGRQQGGILYEFEHSAVGQISEVSCFDPAVVGPYNEYYCHSIRGACMYLARRSAAGITIFSTLASKPLSKAPTTRSSIA